MFGYDTYFQKSGRNGTLSAAKEADQILDGMDTNGKRDSDNDAVGVVPMQWEKWLAFILFSFTFFTLAKPTKDVRDVLLDSWRTGVKQKQQRGGSFEEHIR